jgi:hypothetical protein
MEGHKGGDVKGHEGEEEGAEKGCNSKGNHLVGVHPDISGDKLRRGADRQGFRA